MRRNRSRSVLGGYPWVSKWWTHDQQQHRVGHRRLPTPLWFPKPKTSEPNKELFHSLYSFWGALLSNKISFIIIWHAQLLSHFNLHLFLSLHGFLVLAIKCVTLFMFTTHFLVLCVVCSSSFFLCCIDKFSTLVIWHWPTACSYHFNTRF